MDAVSDVRLFINQILSSYEARIREVKSLREYTLQLMDVTTRERGDVYTRLQEALAKGISLRKKDFDNMVSGIRKGEEEKARELIDLVDILQMEEESMHMRLSELSGMEEIADADSIKVIIDNYVKSGNGERESEINKVIGDFRKEMQKINEALKKLLSCGISLRVEDLKKTVKNISMSLNGRKNNNTEFMKKIIEERRKLEDEVLGMLSRLRIEQERMRKEWHKTVEIMKEKRRES